ncbi:MAG: bifunctional diguanylate cyclase/phosphodiesterase [Cypionkella sp.]|nr:bifunctional diguanylate cyclase/phosphodiesterase [Cypionkella sp.]
MLGEIRGRITGIGMATLAVIRRPEWIVFIPAISLAAFWLGGESSLLAAALGLPMVLAILGAMRLDRDARAAVQSDHLALRNHVVERLDELLQNLPFDGKHTACLVVQFDGADQFLARHGRAAESKVLARSAERICAALRDGDTVARLEGGGFAVALAPAHRLDLETVVQLAARLQAAISAPVEIDAVRRYVSCSVGFCLSSRAPAPTGTALLEAAQVAADEARRNGPGALRVFAPEMARTRADHDALRAELEYALDEGQIRAHFQPQVSTDTGAITGFEALARWYHPSKGLLGPAVFLPLIEAAGLSERLGEVMLQNALAALVRWDGQNLNIPAVSVNLSAEELRNPRLADKIKWELDRFDLNPNRLCVEVLENVVSASDDDVIVANIAALSRLGCGIDLDDFGTGHASITSIRRFAIRRLKIDRSFVTRLDEDRAQQRMISAILSMAERLELATLAEGVETAAEHAMLAQLGCNDVQGFGIARPMPIEETAGWIAAQRCKIGKLPRINHEMR